MLTNLTGRAPTRGASPFGESVTVSVETVANHKRGDPHHGFARVYCPQCRHDYLLAFSCKARYFCLSCHQKRVLAYGDWVESNVLAPVPHRQYVFTFPRIVRAIFARRRRLLGTLCQIVEKLLREAYSAAKPGGREGLILFVQTFGDLVTFNPHIHVLAADGATPEDPIANAVRARSAWARLIYKVYEVDPLECPKCKGQMQIIALIDDPSVVRRILKHLNLWSPAKRFIPARGPPHVAPECAAGEPSNEHTYHPVPDIAQ